MISSVRLRVLLGIILLSCIQSVENENVDINTLSRIQRFFHSNYFNGGQYAVAINVPQEQCRSGFFPGINNFLLNDPSATVKPQINRDSKNVYRGSELIAAGVHNDAHSEYLLMHPPNNSPLTYLMNKNKNGCVVFYTLNSPCIARCINNDIISGLDKLGAYKGIKAFVFTNIYTRDQGKPNLGTQLKKIADRVPLYRCNNTGCILCGEPGSTAVNNRCLI